MMSRKYSNKDWAIVCTLKKWEKEKSKPKGQLNVTDRKQFSCHYN